MDKTRREENKTFTKKLLLYIIIPIEQFDSWVEPINGVVRFDGQAVQSPFPLTSLYKPIIHGTQTPLEFRLWPGMQKALKQNIYKTFKTMINVINYRHNLFISTVQSVTLPLLLYINAFSALKNNN